MNNLPYCPQCSSEYTYTDGDRLICPECAYEWEKETSVEKPESSRVVDAYGKILSEGDNVSIIKDLKVKGSASVIKVGTKLKNIRLVEGDHPIDCKIDGIGAMKLKSEFVKKV